MPKIKNSYYAYQLDSGAKGVCASWSECEKIVKGKQARYRGFPTKAAAQEWLTAGAKYEKKIIPKLKSGIYFDAGTGRGKGVEVNVTNEEGAHLLSKVLPKKDLTEFSTYRVQGKLATNNYGELLGLYFALEIALKERNKRIFGDSRLVIDFWSKGYIKREKVAKNTVALAEEVKELRKKFEKGGGSITHVSGDYNPADLGFHR